LIYVLTEIYMSVCLKRHAIIRRLNLARGHEEQMFMFPDSLCTTEPELTNFETVPCPMDFSDNFLHLITCYSAQTISE